MKIVSLFILLIIYACKPTESKSSESMMFPTSKYEVVTVADKSFTEKDNYQVRIDTDKKVMGGKFDCNNFSVEYTLEDNSNNIDFGYAISTKMYCEGKMEMENHFFSQLSKIKSYKYNDEVLSFFDEADALVFKFKKIKND